MRRRLTPRPLDCPSENSCPIRVVNVIVDSLVNSINNHLASSAARKRLLRAEPLPGFSATLHAVRPQRQTDLRDPRCQMSRRIQSQGPYSLDAGRPGDQERF